MSPLESTRWTVEFAAAASPWWLVLILPLAAWVFWRAYRFQLARKRRGIRITLAAIRLLLVIAVLLLLFKPALREIRTLTFPARILYVVDDSQSMSVADTRMAGPAALYLHRQLHGAGQGELDVYHRLRTIAMTQARAVRRFASFTRTVDRRQDAFWAESRRVEQAVSQGFTDFEELAASVVSTGSEQTAVAMKNLLARVDRLREQMRVLFEGERDPGREAYTRSADELVAIAEQLEQRQQAADIERLKAGNETLEAQVARMRSVKRASLVEQALRRWDPPDSGEAAPAYHRWVRLSDGARGPLGELAPEAVSPQAPHTDILGRLRALAEQRSAYPLAGIVLLSDGADLSGMPGNEVHQLLSERQVPVACAAVGAHEEPYDLAVTNVSAPPFAVAGEPTSIGVELKTLVPTPTEVRLRIMRDSKTLAESEVRVGESTQQRETLAFTPDTTGIFRYTVDVDVLEGEAVGASNNRSQFVINVRDRALRVVYLDAQPNWDVRFALDTLQRLPYAQLDKLIVSMLPGGTLQRGSDRGKWPNDQAAFERCDLIILGTLRPGMLTSGGPTSDWAMLQRFVNEGGTLCFFDAASAMAVPDEMPLARVLEPVTPAGDPAELLEPAAAGGQPGSESGETDGSDPSIQSLQALLLLEDGYYHPITHRLSAQLPVVQQRLLEPEDESIQTLLLTRQLEPLVRTVKVGRGNVVLLKAARLWTVLDPTLSEAHAEMFRSLVQGAVEGEHPVAEGDGPQLTVHHRRLREGTPFQVVVRAPQPNMQIEAVREDRVVATAEAQRRQGMAIATADFPALPPGEITFRIQGAPGIATPTITVVRTGRELVRLARNDAFMAELAQFTGGRKAEVVDLSRLVEAFDAEPRTETHERQWQPGASPWVLGALMFLFVAELVTRKFMGLV